MSLSEDDLIDRFLRGSLSNEEASDFQKRMESDQDLAQRVALEKQLFEVYNEESWSEATNKNHPEVVDYTALFAAEETARIKSAIEVSQQAYQAGATETRERKLNPWWKYSAAATILLLAALLFVFPRKSSPEAIYKNYLSQTELPSVINRGSEEANNILAEAERLFGDRDFEATLELLGTLNEEEAENAAYYIYLSLSLAEVDQHDQAIDTIDRLIRSDLLDSSKGYWFKSLIYLKAEKVAKSKEQLDLIIANQYYQYQLAKELLESF